MTDSVTCNAQISSVRTSQDGGAKVTLTLFEVDLELAAQLMKWNNQLVSVAIVLKNES